MAEDWTDDELRAACEEYARLLDLEAEGIPFVKAEALQRLGNGALSNRTKGSIEMRLQNISYVLDQAEIEWIQGWKPLQNIGGNVRSRVESMLVELDVIEPSSVKAEPARRGPKLPALESELGDDPSYVVCHTGNEWRVIKHPKFKSLDSALFGAMGARASFKGAKSLSKQLLKHGDAEFVLVELDTGRYLITDGVQFTIIAPENLSAPSREGLKEALNRGTKMPFEKSQFER